MKILFGKIKQVLFKNPRKSLSGWGGHMVMSKVAVQSAKNPSHLNFRSYKKNIFLQCTLNVPIDKLNTFRSLLLLNS